MLDKVVSTQPVPQEVIVTQQQLQVSLQQRLKNHKYLLLSAIAALGGIAALYLNSKNQDISPLRRVDGAQGAANCKISLIETLSGKTKGLTTAYCGGPNTEDPFKDRDFDFDKHVSGIITDQHSCYVKVTKEGEAFFSGRIKPRNYIAVFPIKGNGGSFKTYIHR